MFFFSTDVIERSSRQRRDTGHFETSDIVFPPGISEEFTSKPTGCPCDPSERRSSRGNIHSR